MGNRKKIGAALAFLLVLFQLASVSFVSLNELTVRSIHVMLAVSLALIMTPWSKKAKDNGRLPVYDWILVAIVVIASVNILLKNMVIYEMSAPMGTIDVVLGICLFLIVIDSARRTSGWPVVVLTGIALALVYLGPILPDALRTRGLPLGFIIKNMYFSTSGLYGGTTGLSATVLAIFLIFGGILVETKVGDIFVNAALRVAGRARGGPAKVAIVASALMGMISGSSMAICAVTGTYTIPMMKKLGYTSEFAGAVEASSSTGGTFTPPVMALGAFLMAEMLGVSYATICYHAAFLAFLYYLSIYIGVDYEAKYLGLAAMKSADMPPWSSVWGSGRLAVLAIPIIFLFYLILEGVDLTISGFWTCIITLAMFMVIGSYRPVVMKERASAIVSGFVKGGESIANLAPLVITASVLVNVLFVGGLTARLIEVTEAALAQSILGGLALGAIVPLVLGMAVPPIAAYILSAAMLATGLSRFFPPLMVHLFLFFYSCLAQITPPVCGAVFVGAAIAKADWLKTAYIALKLAAVGFIFPFFFMLAPAMVGYHSTFGQTFVYFGASVLGVIAMSVSFFGLRERTAINIISRLAFLVSAIFLLYPSNYLSFWGLGIGAVVIVVRTMLRRRGTRGSNA